MAKTIYERLEDLDRNLATFKVTDTVSWQIAQMFNVLLAEVKKEHGDDPIVSVIEPAERGSIAGLIEGSDSTMDAGTMRTAIAQLLGSLP